MSFEGFEYVHLPNEMLDTLLNTAALANRKTLQDILNLWPYYSICPSL
jgi:hypothetical protein